MVPMWKLLLVASLNVGLKFGWAIRTALLTPYMMQLRLHFGDTLLLWSSTPLSVLLVSPIMAVCSKWAATTRFGKSKPFILVGSVLHCIGMISIGFATDFSQYQTHEMSHHGSFDALRYCLIGGGWLVDLSKGMIEDSVTEFMSALCEEDHRRLDFVMIWFIMFGTLGNVMAYGISWYTQMYTHLSIPLLNTKYCNQLCVNLKACCIINVLLVCIMSVPLFCIVSQPVASEQVVDEEAPLSFLASLRVALGKSFFQLYLAAFLVSMASFPFEVLGSDWVGKDVYKGDPSSYKSISVDKYLKGIREATLGLMIGTIVVGFISSIFNPLERVLGGVRRTLSICTIVFAIALASTMVLRKVSELTKARSPTSTYPPQAIRISTLVLFGVMGIPLAATDLVLLLLIKDISTRITTNPSKVISIATVALNLFKAVAEISGLALVGGTNVGYKMFLVGGAAAALGVYCNTPYVPARCRRR